jgi:hypothetical protein
VKDFIGKDQLRKIGERYGKSEYGKYLLRLSEEGLP